MVYISYNKLLVFSKKVLANIGASKYVVDSLAKGLCDASLRGVDSHGIKLLYHYVNAAKNGKKNLKPSFKLTKKFPAISLLDADKTFGITAGYKAIDYAIKDAKKYGISMVVVNNSTHPGALASICIRAANQGFGILGFTNSDALMLTYNGKTPLLGTNPICFASPFEKDNPFCLDMATTTFTWNKLLNFKNLNKILPDNVAANKKGVRTKDPSKAFSLLPLGGYKGFGLAIMVEILTAIIANMPLDYEIPRMFANTKKQRKISQSYILFNINIGGSKIQFKNNLKKLSRKIRSEKNNKYSAMIPNDKENIFKKERQIRGIPINKNIYDDLKKLSDMTGVKLKINE